MSTNEAAERLREFLAEISNDLPSDALRDLSDALTHERRLEVERLTVDEHWHRGPGASCSICRFGERSAGAAPIDVEALREAIDSFIRSNTGFDVDDAEAIAAEYARLASEGTDR